MQLTGRTKKIIGEIKKEQQALNDKLQVALLMDLVEKLDPDHNYSFDIEKMEFVKTSKPKLEGEGDES